MTDQCPHLDVNQLGQCRVCTKFVGKPVGVNLRLKRENKELNDKLETARTTLKSCAEWAHSDFCGFGKCHPFHDEVNKALEDTK